MPIPPIELIQTIAEGGGGLRVFSDGGGDLLLVLRRALVVVRHRVAVACGGLSHDPQPVEGEQG